MKSSDFKRLFDVETFRKKDSRIHEVDIATQYEYQYSNIQAYRYWLVLPILELYESTKNIDYYFYNNQSIDSALKNIGYSEKQSNKFNINPELIFLIEDYLKRSIDQQKQQPITILDQYNNLLSEHKEMVKLYEENSKKEVRIVNTFKRCIEKNLSSTYAYIDALLDQYECLNILRISLFFNEDSYGSLDRLKELLSKLTVALYKKYKTMVGYVWKIESNAFTFYAHVLIIENSCMNSRTMLDDALSMTDRIGEFWVSLGNEGELGYFSQHALLNQFINTSKNCHNKKQLDCFIESIFKYDYLFKVKTNLRVLGRGELPKQSSPASNK